MELARTIRDPTRRLLVVLVAATLTLLATPAPGSGTSHRDDRTIVVLVSELGPGTRHVADTVARLGGRVLHRFAVIDGFSARLPAGAVGALRATPGVRWVTPDRTVRLEAQYGQDSGVASAVYTDVVRASKAWGLGVTGKGVGVALVDTGVNTGGDLAGQVLHAEDFTAEQDNQDNYGHGTFVAGLIAGTGAGSSGAVRGVAPDAKIVSLKIAGRDGSTDVTRVLEALEWVVDFRDTYGIRVVNLSLGFDSQQSYLVDPLDFAVERVWNAGVVVVAAAGNAGAVGSITAPGNDPRVITVGASNDRTTLSLTDDNVTSFSSLGPTVDGLAKPDVVAPGRSVVSSRSPGSAIDVAYPSSEVGTSYARGSGTSFATAITSAAAALVISRTASLTPDQVKWRITSTARAIGSGAPPPGSGSGSVDAFAASMSTDLTSANQGIAPATGGGSLQATRGSACLRDASGACMSDADADALLGFDASQYFSEDWAGSQWVGSQWVGSQWVGSQWVASAWLQVPS